MKKNAYNKIATYNMYGKHAVFAALKNSNRKINNIFCTKNIYNKHYDTLKEFSVTINNNEQLNIKTGNQNIHQGIVANVNPLCSSNFDSLDINHSEIVILDHIQDPHNLGNIIRSSAAFGIKNIIITNDNSTPENALVAKAASGCLESINIIKVVNLRNAIIKLKKLNFWIIGLDNKSSKAIELYQISPIKKYAIIIGSEFKGVRRLTLNSCDIIAKIPIIKTIESLNAASAAAISLYQLTNKNNKST
ncbi:23S rRNA (guanosine(2251)-2'-O)-methyltransferase RlmB [Rickettsia endosymbiont of Cardiosporidium cionae]|uniref:23S rRNA (guanosine(2251)-2'-O)-methyltransferase RlmB n=1 Tax=Rickettsia endosymbiont of Cardiosporidium cionae TaxID=2777155 RepID=UPI00189466FF|nr:23S rRNA (guanosine(2251)-2'-O)-methyltransferase RlmB [Rickettsia endosymbiont of Cardiosporidium cionae]KAF8818205.1 23S rRNA (guanosine(2251)-2'-O)-methyltransferase RlmB [Rickettsia endosymbiont of Cardiosporidium cionae]